jgi:hypothetical protein
VKELLIARGAAIACKVFRGSDATPVCIARAGVNFRQRKIRVKF